MPTMQIIAPMFNPWVAKIGKDEFNNLLKQENVKPVIKKEVEQMPVVLRIQEVNRNGRMKIEFNQRCRLPAFVDRPAQSEGTNKTAPTAKKRMLIPLDEIDVSFFLNL